MNTSKDLFSHFACILPIKDMDTSLHFYRDKLGFTVTFEWNDPPEYVILKKGESISIHLTRKQDDTLPSSQHSVMYIFVYNPDIIYQECIRHNILITTPIGDRDYHMRDFSIQDPDGYIITFGKGIDT